MERFSGLSESQLNAMLGTGASKEPKLPNCIVCYDLGNYEVAIMSDKTEIPKWIYNGKYTVENKKEVLVDVGIEDNAKNYAARNPGVTEATIYRIHCPKCHPKFVDKHNECVAIIKDKNIDETTRNLAKAELSKAWGLRT